jgi:hypothetical protein
VVASENRITSPRASATAAFCAAVFPRRSGWRCRRTPRPAKARAISSVRSVEQSEATTTSSFSAG